MKGGGSLGLLAKYQVIPETRLLLSIKAEVYILADK